MEDGRPLRWEEGPVFALRASPGKRRQMTDDGLGKFYYRFILYLRTSRHVYKSS
jgi:hypothetical protein